jgi:hypothetical protein
LPVVSRHTGQGDDGGRSLGEAVEVAHGARYARTLIARAAARVVGRTVGQGKQGRTMIERPDHADFSLTQKGLGFAHAPKSLVLLEATPGIEPGYTVLQTVA